MIADVANQKVTVRVERDAVRPVQLRLRGWPAVARKSRRSRPRDRRDHVRARIDAAHHVRVTLDNVEVAGTVETNLVGGGDLRLCGGAAVPAVALDAGAGDGRDRGSAQVQAPNESGVDLAEVQRAVGEVAIPVVLDELDALA